jgi:Undecaprenyl-phosphate glucose phosphotransferase
MSASPKDSVDLATRQPQTLNPPMSSRLVTDLVPVFDCVVLLVASQAGIMLSAAWMPLATPIADLRRFGQLSMALAIMAAFILYDRQLATLAQENRIADTLRRHTLRFSLLAASAFALLLLGRGRQPPPTGLMSLWIGTGYLVTTGARLFSARYLSRIHRRESRTKVIAIVGAGPLADRLSHTLRIERPGSVELLGIFDDAHSAHPIGAESNGTVTELLALGRRRKIDWILLAQPPQTDAALVRLLQRLRTLPAPIGLCPQHVGLDVPFRTVDYVGGRLPVTLLADRPIRRWDAVLKAAEDFIGGSIITLMLLPLMAGIALALKLSGAGPILFRQRRHALNNREFDIYKFRTMHWAPERDSAELRQTARQDARVTRIGRFLRSSSLDELPQLFNVLKGEMSLVGPRPHAINMRTEAKLGAEITDIYAHRHRVKPGMTGWSQVNGSRGPTETTEQLRKRVELDVYYIENWSLLLDIRILLLTAREVVKRTNAY